MVVVSIKKSVEPEKQLTNGDFYVINGVGNYDSGAQDYLSFGLWAYAPTSGTPNIGFYVDGGDPFTKENITNLTGSASYEGDALAIYNSGSDVYLALGDVALKANFDTDKISGDITNIDFMDEDFRAAYGLKVALKATDIDSSKEGGFWTGDTLTTNTENDDQYVGKWGGQFYGNGNAFDKPKFAAGTFGGAAVADTDAIGSFVGSFIAEKD